jgi:DNA-binding beta-propeller fold protein YncE
MKLRRISKLIGFGLAAICLASLNGCGTGGGANVITISVMSSVGNSIILGQSTTLTATVTGATNTNVNWEPCQYTTTTTNSNGTTTTSSKVNCPTDGSFGTLSNEQATGTATYLAPNQLPDQTKFPGLQLIFTVQSQQNTAKTGSITLILDSGIGVALNTTTATVPTEEQEQFFATLVNDLQNKHVTWLLTQNIPTTTGTTTTTYPQLPTCSPSCGTITPDTNNPNVAIYTAPKSVPTSITPAQTNNTNPPANVTIVATSQADSSRFAAGTITVVAGGPITFNGISPTIAPQGAAYWDIFLDAPNISSASQITLTDSSGGTNVKLSGSGQIKILFPIPITTTTTTGGVTTTTVTNPNSTGARLRLNSSDLLTSGPFSVSVSDPGQPVTAPNPPSAYTFTVIPVRPTSIASVPDDIVQGTRTQDTRVIIDGGYFGPSGSSGSLANVFFQGTADVQDSNNPSTARQLNTLLPTSEINSNSPGLYPLSVARTVAPLPALDNPAVTNIAIFPDYSTNPPAVVSTAPVAAGTNPSAIDIDPILGVAVVAETGSNAVQFYSISAGALTPINSSGAACGAACPVPVGKVPTGLSVNRTNHTVAVVNYQDQSVTVLPIPGAPQAPGTPVTIDISGALQNSVTPAPLPYSIGVDPDSNLALVAYSSTSISSAANLGFIVNLNPNTADASGKATNPYGCGLGLAINSSSNQFGQCLFSQVTLNTGVYPQIAVSPHGHLALVTPGGSGVVRGVDATKPSTSNALASATLTAGLVTVMIDTTGKVNPNTTLSLVPGNAGSVLITGMKPGNNANSALFNGVFPVTVTSSTSFTYAVNSTASDTASPGPNGATVFYGQPDRIFSISATAQGVAINPVTNTAAIADANSTGNNGPQIDLLNALNQSITSITFHATCTAFTTNCSNAPELLGTADVAWQPYTNALVSYNPQQNQVSISDPVSLQRYAFACQTATAPPPCLINPSTPADQQTFLNQITLSGTGSATLTVQNGTTNSLNLFGGLAVDPPTNQAFVVKSGSGSIDIVNLGPTPATAVKPTQISELLVPSPTPGLGVIGGIPNALVPQATLTCIPTPPAPASSCDLPGVRIFGSGFASGATVHLDGVDITTKGGSITSIAANGREIDVTIPSFFLSAPHHYSLDVFSSGAPSNSADFIVIQSIDMSKICTGTNSQPVNTQPTSVAIADQIANGRFSPIALVSNSGCNSISEIDINPANATFGTLIGNPIPVGTAPQGIAISQRYGLAVVANNGSGTASILDLTQNPPVAKVPDVSTGTNPTGVAVNDATGAAIVANTGSNTVTMLNFGSLFPPSGTTPPTTLTPTSIGGIQEPIAVAIDPDRGTTNQGIAVVTALQLSTGSAPSGALAVVEIALATPSLSTTISSGTVTATPTGIVFDPIAFTGTANSGLFYANSSGSNTITAFNPDSGGGSSVNVGINPTSLALNPQTGAILTVNSASNTISIVDTLSNPFKTRQTLAIPGSPTFGVAIDQFTNLAVIVDQANNRVLLFPMPN